MPIPNNDKATPTLKKNGDFGNFRVAEGGG